MRARYYNSDIKRFINQDIKVGDIGNSQSLNRYAYCEGNPVSLVDPFDIHTILGIAGFGAGLVGGYAGIAVSIAADVADAVIYFSEGETLKGVLSLVCAIPAVGDIIGAVRTGSKLAKVAKVIGNGIRSAQKLYITAEAATTAIELAGDAKMEYAVNGSEMNSSIAYKGLGAAALLGIAVLSGKSLMKDVSAFSKAADINFKTKSQTNADIESGKCPKGEGIGCFIAETKVKTEDGEKNIEDVQEGDYVLAEDPETGEQGYKQVVRTYIHEKTTIVHVFVGEEEIETTVEHPFYVEGVGFVSAGELKAGDIIRTSKGKNLPIDKIEIEELDEPVLVYNFEVEDFHTYYVSDLGVLVHNICGDTTGGGKVGEGGKTSTGYTYWSKSIQFDGNKVYQRNDLFDPMQVSSWKRNGKTITGTNIERMAAGNAPIGYDGKSVNLHHLLQTPDGPIVEVSNSFHKQYYSTIHMNTGKSPSLINRNEFNKWASKYWMNRSLDFQ